MSEPIRVAVDPTNPGQFFACCGLLELADRLWPGAEGWFAEGGREFRIDCGHHLADLVEKVASVDLTRIDEDDMYSGRVRIGLPAGFFDLDWWHELGGRRDAKDLKVWAGTMTSHGIARAMQHAMRSEAFCSFDLFDIGMVVPDPDDDRKKKEPYYFDARRAPNAHTRDVGFSANALDLTTTAYPAVEFLCLVGLQRCTPVRTDKPRVYDYFTWATPTPPALLPAVVPGAVQLPGACGYRFENWYRTGQKKHKAFRPAELITPTGE